MFSILKVVKVWISNNEILKARFPDDKKGTIEEKKEKEKKKKRIAY